MDIETQDHTLYGSFFKDARNVVINNPTMIGVDAMHLDMGSANPVGQAMNPWDASIAQYIRAQQDYDLIEGVDDIRDPSSKPQPPQHPQSYPRVVLQTTLFLIRQIYSLCLLRLPSLYFSRVERIFVDAELSLPELKKATLEVLAGSKENKERLRSYKKLNDRWQTLIDNLLEEWRTLNIVSALLVPGILTMFQITDAAARDPVTRYLVFWSLISALLSLLYGSFFIIRFSQMRKSYKIIEWAVEARKRQTIYWNVWVMLSMPVAWLTWSILAFIICVMWFMWRTHADLPEDDHFSASRHTERGFRIFISAVLGIGVAYAIRISLTFRHYGTKMEDAWQRRVQEWQTDLKNNNAQLPHTHTHRPSIENRDGNASSITGSASTSFRLGPGPIQTGPQGGANNGMPIEWSNTPRTLSSVPQHTPTDNHQYLSPNSSAPVFQFSGCRIITSFNSFIQSNVQPCQSVLFSQNIL